MVGVSKDVTEVRIDKDIYVRDGYGVRRRAFLAGDTVPAYVYHSVLAKNTIVGEIETKVLPEAKPEKGVKEVGKDVESKQVELKVEKAVEPEVEKEVEPVKEVEVKEVEEPKETKKGKK